MSARTLAHRLDKVTDRLHSDESYVELDDGSQVYVGRFGMITASLRALMTADGESVDRFERLSDDECHIYAHMAIPSGAGELYLGRTLRAVARERLGLDDDDA